MDRRDVVRLLGAAALGPQAALKGNAVPSPRFSAPRMARDYVKLYESMLGAKPAAAEPAEVDSLLTL